ncbi:unnamed protein product [Didymodactylos carnosus]|uniref:NAD(P)(+)--arginine ADP-ribosyltransferase n=1 Tax=Didymodactylos carnosus TaxID=1234261 RepID=A0A814U9T6_9BILA|nr:unnamed protein product [Didymodactylos carnosus]CAF1609225.1 unnamed protein product [Didymodactylos carnosus]CAF3936289.1 unnamed protein product [Didymodactylos carnosus]CAF4422476.1 unnamed protein product [Didymodactylos carnosus]
MASRFFDIVPIALQSSSNLDYIHSPLVSLETAVQPVAHLIDNLSLNVNKAKQVWSILTPENGLTTDEAAAIHLYTTETNSYRSIYRRLNEALRLNISSYILVWHLYLKLLRTGLEKIPSRKTTVWRGVRKDLSHQLYKGKRFTWLSVTSCSGSVNQIKNFLRGKGTIFTIDSVNGKPISSYSQFKSEDEVILLPGTELVTVADPLDVNGVWIIHLRELAKTSNAYLKTTVLPLVQSAKSHKSAAPSPSPHHVLKFLILSKTPPGTPFGNSITLPKITTKTSNVKNVT